MKQIIGYLKVHIKEDFNPSYYAFIAVFLFVSFYINYSLGFKRSILDAEPNQYLRLGYYFLFFAFAYFIPSLGYALFYKTRRFITSPAFWGLSLLIIGVLTLNRATLIFTTSIIDILETPPEVRRYFWLILLYTMRTVTMMAPLIIYYWIWDRDQPGMYGFTTRNFNLTPYVWMLAIMLPLIVWASFQPAFLKTYPRYKPTMAEEFLELPYLLTMLGFHVIYAIRFVSVEFFFRGFAILGMPKEMGRAVVMPAAVLYAFWHFGKPMGEALGSIFGSYILGVIALESGSILGGIIVHIGIALLMDWAAYIQSYQLK
jgi:hypothetical protein